MLFKIAFLVVWIQCAVGRTSVFDEIKVNGGRGRHRILGANNSFSRRPTSEARQTSIPDKISNINHGPQKNIKRPRKIMGSKSFRSNAADRPALVAEKVKSDVKTVSIGERLSSKMKVSISSTDETYTSGYFLETSYQYTDCTGFATSFQATEIGGCINEEQKLESVTLQNDLFTANYGVYYSGNCGGLPAYSFSDSFSSACQFGTQYSWALNISIPGVQQTSGYLVSATYDSFDCMSDPSYISYRFVISSCTVGPGVSSLSTIYNTVPDGVFVSTFSYSVDNCEGVAQAVNSYFYATTMCVYSSKTLFETSVPTPVGQQIPGYLQTTTFSQENCEGFLTFVEYTPYNASNCILNSAGSQINEFYIGARNFTVTTSYATTNCSGTPMQSTWNYYMSTNCTGIQTLSFSANIQFPAIVGYANKVFPTEYACLSDQSTATIYWTPSFCNYGTTLTCSAGAVLESEYVTAACTGDLFESFTIYPGQCGSIGYGYSSIVCTSGESYLPYNVSDGYLEVLNFASSDCSGSPNSTASTKIGSCFWSITTEVIVNEFSGSLTAIGSDYSDQSCSVQTSGFSTTYSTTCINGVLVNISKSLKLPSGESIVGGYVKDTEYVPVEYSPADCSAPVDFVAYFSVGLCVDGTFVNVIQDEVTIQRVAVYFGFSTLDCSNDAAYTYQQAVDGQCSNNARLLQVSSVAIPTGHQLPASYVQTFTSTPGTGCELLIPEYFYYYDGASSCIAGNGGSHLFEVLLLNNNKMVENNVQYTQSQCGGNISLAFFEYSILGSCQDNEVVSTSPTVSSSSYLGFYNITYSTASDCVNQTNAEFGEWHPSSECVGGVIYECLDGEISKYTYSASNCQSDFTVSSITETCGLSSFLCTPFPITTGFVYQSYFQDADYLCNSPYQTIYNAIGTCVDGTIITSIFIEGETMTVSVQSYFSDNCTEPDSMSSQYYSTICDAGTVSGWVPTIEFPASPSSGFLVINEYFNDTYVEDDIQYTENSCGPLSSQSFTPTGSCITFSAYSSTTYLVVLPDGMMYEYVFKFPSTDCSGNADIVLSYGYNTNGSCPSHTYSADFPDVDGTDLGTGYFTGYEYGNLECSGSVTYAEYFYAGCSCSIYPFDLEITSYIANVVAQLSTNILVINLYLGNSICSGNATKTILMYFNTDVCTYSTIFAMKPSIEYPKTNGYLDMTFASESQCLDIYAPTLGNWYANDVCTNGYTTSCQGDTVSTAYYNQDLCTAGVNYVQNQTRNCNASFNDDNDHATAQTFVCTNINSNGAIFRPTEICAGLSSPPSSPPSSSPSSSPSSPPLTSPNAAAIYGAIVGSIAGVGLLAGGAYYVFVVSSASAMSASTAGGAASGAAASGAASGVAGTTTNPLAGSAFELVDI